MSDGAQHVELRRLQGECLSHRLGGQVVDDARDGYFVLALELGDGALSGCAKECGRELLRVDGESKDSKRPCS